MDGCWKCRVPPVGFLREGLGHGVVNNNEERIWRFWFLWEDSIGKRKAEVVTAREFIFGALIFHFFLEKNILCYSC